MNVLYITYKGYSYNFDGYVVTANLPNTANIKCHIFCALIDLYYLKQQKDQSHCIKIKTSTTEFSISMQ